MKFTAAHTSALAASGCLALFLLAKMFAQPPGLLIYSANGSGRGQGAILHAGTGVTADNAHPASAGEAIEIYITGLSPELQECPAAHPCEALGIEVAIAGLPAPILYFGRPPQLSHRAQLNVRLPEGIEPGIEAPVSVRSGDRQSNEVTIAVR
jgi:uncharacterized protein (TIGR03437 family)